MRTCYLNTVKQNKTFFSDFNSVLFHFFSPVASLFQKSLEAMQGHGNLRRRERNDMDKTTSKKDSPEKKKRKINDETYLQALFD